MDDMRFTAPDGCVLVRTEAPKEQQNGVHKPVWTVAADRPDRGTVVSKANVEGVEIGDTLAYDHTEASKVADNLWSVPEKAFYGILEGTA